MMKPDRAVAAKIVLGLTLACLPALGQTQPAQTDPIVWLRHIAAELGRLRLEMAEHRAECSRDRMPQLETELRTLTQERERLSNEEQAHRRELQQIDQMLAATNDPEERKRMEALKKELEANTIVKLQNATATVSRRESELNERLDAERKKIEQLNAYARQLTAWLNGK